MKGGIMKKIFILLLILFTCITVKAKEISKLEIKWIPNVYYNYKKNNLTYWGQLGYLYVDGKIAYCLEINKTLTTTEYQLSNEVISDDKILLAGYFGYGYNNEVNLKDYIATQKIIWNYLGTNVYFTTKSKGEGNIINIDDYESKIKNRIDKYQLMPNIGNNFIFYYGSDNNINDTNKIINTLDLINNSNNIIEINNNSLIFNANEIGKNEFYLKTKYMNKYNNQVYIANNSQKVMIIGNISNLTSKYNYEVVGGSIRVNVIANKSIDLRNNIFELYDSNNKLINEYQTDSNGNILINDLKIGKYILKQTKVIEGYKVLEDTHEINILKDNINVEKTIELVPITLNVNIIKTYGYEKFNIINYDNNVSYDIYNDDNYITTITTDSNGFCNILLEYGNYRIVQNNISNVNVFHNDLIITKEDFNEKLKEFKIFDELSNVILKIIPINYDNEIISNVEFNINDDNYKIDDIYYIDLEYGTYNFSNIKSNGYKNIEDFIFVINDDSDLYVENNKLYIDLYIKFDKEIIINEIDDEIERPKLPNLGIYEEDYIYNNYMFNICWL